jgi:chemotaxis signal transduction protein
MKILRNARRKPLPRPGEAAILFAIGEYSFLIAADEVEEIRDMQGMVSVATATMRTSVAKIKSTVEKAGLTYFVVDGSSHFQLMPSRPTRLMMLRNQSVAVTVESIDRMTEIGKVLPLPKAFTGPERLWYRGLAVTNDKVVPVVNGTAFLTAAEQVIARAALSRGVGRGVMA